MAGYSSRSLVDKLGLKSGHNALFVAAPDGYENTLGRLPPDLRNRSVTLAQAKSKALSKSAPFDFIQCFCRGTETTESILPVLKSLLATDGMLWLSWPKRTKPAKADAIKKADAAKTHASKKSDGAKPVGEAEIRASGLAAGLVDIKVCAVDETWSGLKFVIRRKDR